MLYKATIINPPVLNVVENPVEIVLSLVSCMCDNISYICIKKTDDDVVIRHYNERASLSLSNLQMKGDYHSNIRFAFLEGDLEKVFEIINTGTSAIFGVKSR